VTSPAAVLEFWFADGPDTWRDAWFKPDAAFDAAIAEKFAATLETAANGTHDSWAASAPGALALAIVLDQLPRNLFRGTARAFATDARALAVARATVARRHDLALAPTQRVFLYLPFEHSEVPADQELSCALFEGLRDDPRFSLLNGAIDYAWRHRAVIQKFGRYPHRNAALGRASTAPESAWLAAGGGF
jgi:uncharacterized protein (DUF924 family)